MGEDYDYNLYLDPKRIDPRNRHSSKTAEEVLLWYGIEPTARQMLSDALLSDKDLKLDELSQRVVAEIRDHPVALIRAAIANEAEVLVSYCAEAVSDVIGEEHLEDEEELSKLIVDEEYLDAVLPPLASSLKRMRFLETAHGQATIRSTVLPLLRQAQANRRDHEEGHNRFDKVDDMYKQIQDLLDGKALVPLESLHHLVLLMYVDRMARFPFHELLWLGDFIEFCQQQREATDDKEVKKVWDLMGHFLRASVLWNNHWGQLVKQNEHAEETFRTTEHNKGLKTRIAEQLYMLKDSDAWDTVKQALVTVEDELRGKITGLPHHVSWEHSDWGHCFRMLFPTSMLANRTESMRSFERNPKKKDGRQLVILEDDSSQMEVWQWHANKCSPFSLPEGTGACAKPDQVHQHIDNPDVQLFLLDVQNGNDPIAGITTAGKILDKRLDEADAGRPVPTRIVIFSNSDEALALADKAFLPQAAMHLPYFALTQSNGHQPYGQEAVIELIVVAKEDFDPRVHLNVDPDVDQN